MSAWTDLRDKVLGVVGIGGDSIEVSAVSAPDIEVSPSIQSNIVIDLEPVADAIEDLGVQVSGHIDDGLGALQADQAKTTETNSENLRLALSLGALGIALLRKTA